MQNPSTCNCECNKACKIDEYLDIKNCQCKKRLIDKIALACEDEILNTTEASLDDKKVTLPYSHYVIGNYVIISCHFYQLLLLLYKISIKKNIYYHLTTPATHFK